MVLPLGSLLESEQAPELEQVPEQGLEPGPVLEPELEQVPEQAQEPGLELGSGCCRHRK